MSCCNAKCSPKIQKMIEQKLFSKTLFIGALILYGFALLADFEIFRITFNTILLNLLFLICYFALGYGILKEALNGILKREMFNENTLMVLASLSAFCIGESAEAVGILVFYRIGEALQASVVEKTKKQIRSLNALKVESARIMREGRQILIAPQEIQKGDRLVVFAGERIPADGKIIEGSSHIDNSALSGESLPQSVNIGDSVLSGGINLEGVLRIQATQSYADSAFSKILQLIEEGNAQKSKSEEFITKFARFYTPLVTLLAFGIAFFPTLYFWILGEDFIEMLKIWSYRGIIFLVISCPCALVLSIPLTFFVSLGKASCMGILVKGSSYLEALNSVGVIVFDKTGTLTTGKLRLKEIQVCANYDKEFVLKIAKKLESHSNHPIAKAIANANTAQEESQEVVENLKEHAGGGISATINGKRFALGNARFVESLLKQRIQEKQSAKLQVFLSLENQVIGSIILEDTFKIEAKESLERLKSRSMNLVMLSGDKQSIAQEVADNVGIGEYYAELLPDEKVAHLKEILKSAKTRGKKVIFVGDGINDAPALALSDIGIAMGKAGSDIAIDGADIVILDDDLNKIPQILAIANKTRKILWENIIFSLGTKVAIMVFGVLGVANLWLALFGDVGVALLALLNAQRAIR